jgi:hypothetical protein
MTEPSADATPLTDAQVSAKAELEQIYSDPRHSYNQVGARDYDAAAAHVLGLRRLLLGAENRPAVEYREAEDDRVPVSQPAATTVSALYSREDFLTGIPGDVPTPERHRAAAAVEACGLTWFEGQQLLNATEGPVPHPADELDLAELWGDAANDNARAVNRVLTQLRAVDADLHDKLLPFIQRRAAVANRVLAIAKRLRR